MTEIEFIADGENQGVGVYSKGMVKEVADDKAKILVDRDGVAKRTKKQKDFKKKVEVLDNGGE